jgi:hypothetical protein
MLPERKSKIATLLKQDGQAYCICRSSDSSRFMMLINFCNILIYKKLLFNIFLYQSKIMILISQIILEVVMLVKNGTMVIA